MNVLFLTSTLPRFENDGQSPFVLEQAMAWKNEKPQDNVYILAPGDRLAKEEENKNGIQIYRFSYWWPKGLQKLVYPAMFPNIKRNPLLLIQVPSFLIAAVLATLKFTEEYAINLIYAHWVMPQGLVAYWTKKINKIPYVLQNHSSDIRIFDKIGFLGRCLARKIIKSSHRLFCVNSRLRKEAIELFDDPDSDEISQKTFSLPMGIVYSENEIQMADNPHQQKYDLP